MPRLSEGEFGGLVRKLADPEQGGFTVDPRTGQNVTSGISVAPMDNEATFKPATGPDLAAYTEANEPRFERGRATMLGGWRGPNETDYIDTPTVHPHTPGGGGHARARRQMVLSDQIASFDLDSFQEEHNPFHPAGREERGMPPHEIAGRPRTDKDGNPTMSIAERRKQAEFANAQPEVQAWINSPRQGRGS